MTCLAAYPAELGLRAELKLIHNAVFIRLRSAGRHI